MQVTLTVHLHAQTCVCVFFFLSLCACACKSCLCVCVRGCLPRMTCLPVTQLLCVCITERERLQEREKKGKWDINISWSVCSPGSLDICQGQGTTGKIVIEEIREQKTQWKSKKGNKLENRVDVSKRWELEKKRIYIYGETDRLKLQTWSSLATL